MKKLLKVTGAFFTMLFSIVATLLRVLFSGAQEASKYIDDGSQDPEDAQAIDEGYTSKESRNYHRYYMDS